MMTVTYTVTAEIKNARPSRTAGRNGGLIEITKREIQDRLGLAPTPVDASDGKVTMRWSFDVDGKHFEIWDYKGSSKRNAWSTMGDQHVLRAIFDGSFEKFDF